MKEFFKKYCYIAGPKKPMKIIFRSVLLIAFLCLQVSLISGQERKGKNEKGMGL